MPSLGPTQEQIQDLGSHIQDQGKIAQLIQLRALSWLNQSEKRQAQTDDAERRWYAKQIGEPLQKSDSDDMETTILGDINIMQPPTPQQHSAMSQPTQPQSNLPAIALAALLSTIGGGAAGYYFSGKNQPEVPEFDAETLNIGLGKIEDYLQKGE